MSDSTKPGTVVSLFTPSDGSRDSPIDDSCARQIPGQLLTFVGKEYYVCSSRNRVELPLGTRAVVLAIWSGWKFWRDGKIAEYATQIDGHYPQRHELGFLDE